MKRDKRKMIPDAMQEKIANKIVRRCIQIQARWAAWMQRCFQMFSTGQQKIILVVMSVIFLGISVYLIVRNISGSNENFKVAAPIKVPAHILKSGEPQRGTTGNRKVFNEIEEYKKIEQLKHYRDSIINKK